jgi:hypothetical protein
MQKEFFVFISILSLLLVFPLVSANRGSMTIGPRDVRLEESGQNAIVAWNGNEEIIILSTDMKSSESTLVLELIPLPSNPTKVEEGSSESFTKLVEIVNRKAGEMREMVLGPGIQKGEVTGVEITFHEKIGPHDVTIVKVNDLDYFINWVKDFSTNQDFEYTEIPSNFKTTISNYLDRNIDHFVFDVIETNESSQTVNPLIYRFESDYLYYPIEITSTSDVGWSSSRINVFLIAKGIIDQTVIFNSGLFPRTGFGEYNIKLTRDELREISPELEDLFKSDPFVMNAQYFGPLNTLEKDLIVYQEDISQPPVDYTDLFTTVFFAIAVLLIVIVIYKIFRY